MKQEEKGSSISLHAHGDGTYHTQGDSWGPSGPSRVDHDSMGAALMHIASKHAEGDHMHILSHDDGFTTHHVMEGGKVQGPHDHKNLRELKRAMSQFLDEEGQEG